MSKHTPGPWYAKGGQIAAENDPKGRTFALIPYYDHEPEQDANARLIAAAPALLAACELVERAYAGDGVDMSTAVDACLRAIAEGRQP